MRVYNSHIHIISLIMKTLKTLNEHNHLIGEFYEDSNKPQPNGIECPDCKEELYDTNPGVILTSYPPQKNIGCLKCGYSGYRKC